jgi:hypothetical protein
MPPALQPAKLQEATARAAFVAMIEKPYLDAVDEPGSLAAFKGDPDDRIVADSTHLAFNRVDLRRREAIVYATLP